MVDLFMTDETYLRKLLGPDANDLTRAEMIQGLRDVNLHGPMTLGKFTDMLKAKVQQDPAKTFDSFVSQLTGILGMVKDRYPQLGEMLERTVRRIKFKEEAGTDPSMQETRAAFVRQRWTHT